jgi:hypothetical protein
MYIRGFCHFEKCASAHLRPYGLRLPVSINQRSTNIESSTDDVEDKRLRCDAGRSAAVARRLQACTSSTDLATVYTTNTACVAAGGIATTDCRRDIADDSSNRAGSISGAATDDAENSASHRSGETARRCSDRDNHAGN